MNRLKSHWNQRKERLADAADAKEQCQYLDQQDNLSLFKKSALNPNCPFSFQNHKKLKALVQCYNRYHPGKPTTLTPHLNDMIKKDLYPDDFESELGKITRWLVGQSVVEPRYRKPRSSKSPVEYAMLQDANHPIYRQNPELGARIGHQTRRRKTRSKSKSNKSKSNKSK